MFFNSFYIIDYLWLNLLFGTNYPIRLVLAFIIYISHLMPSLRLSRLNKRFILLSCQYWDLFIYISMILAWKISTWCRQIKQSQIVYVIPWSEIFIYLNLISNAFVQIIDCIRRDDVDEFIKSNCLSQWIIEVNIDLLIGFYPINVVIAKSIKICTNFILSEHCEESPESYFYLFRNLFLPFDHNKIKIIKNVNLEFKILELFWLQI